jgi:hypothetical protein
VGEILKDFSKIATKRIGLAQVFYPLDQNEKIKWGRIMCRGFDALLDKLGSCAEDLGYVQKTASGKAILWQGKNDSAVECLVCWVDDVMDLDQVEAVFHQIRKYQPVFTYAIVHQVKDGEGNYDSFRFSRFSYLEHCNRVRAPKRRKLISS